MKIAILLRGVSRKNYLAAKLWERTIKRFHQYDFKVFMHTWSTVEKNIPRNDEVVSHNQVYDFLEASRHDIYENSVKIFNPIAFKIGGEYQMIDCIKKIVDINSNDGNIGELTSFLCRQNPEFSLTWLIKLLTQPLPELNHERINTLMILRRWISQFWSNFECFKLYKDYSIKEKWIPDIILVVRPDCFFRNDIQHNFFEEIKKRISNEEYLSLFKGKKILVPAVCSVGFTPNNHDQCHGMCSDTADHVYGDYDPSRLLTTALTGKRLYDLIYTSTNFTSNRISANVLGDHIRGEDIWTYCVYPNVAAVGMHILIQMIIRNTQHDALLEMIINHRISCHDAYNFLETHAKNNYTFSRREVSTKEIEEAYNIALRN